MAIFCCSNISLVLLQATALLDFFVKEITQKKFLYLGQMISKTGIEADSQTIEKHICGYK